MAAAVAGWSPVTTIAWMPARGPSPSPRGSRPRSGSANPMSARIRAAVALAGGPGRRSAPRSAAAPSIRTSHAVRVHADRRDSARTASGAPIRSVSTRPSRRAGCGRTGGDRRPARHRGARRGRGAPTSRPPPPPRISERVNELGGEPPPIAQASSSARSASSRIAEPVVGVLDRAGGRPDRRDVEPVAGQRPGLVGDDQVDGAERLLGVEPADEHAPLEEAVGPGRGRPRGGSAAPRGSRRSPPRCRRGSSPRRPGRG